MRYTTKTRVFSLALAGLALVCLVSWDFSLPLPNVLSAPASVFDSYNEEPSENDQWVLYQNDPREPAEVLSVVPADN